MVTEVMHFTECKDFWSNSSGVSVPQDTLLFVLTCSQSKKCSLKLNQTSSRKSGSLSILFSNHRHITLHFSISPGVSICLVFVLDAYSWRSFLEILCNNISERPSSWERVRRDFSKVLPTESLTAFTLSRHLAVNFLPDLVFSTFLLRLFNAPVSGNLCTQRWIWLFRDNC